MASTGEQTVEFDPFLLAQEGAEFEWILEWDIEDPIYPLTTTQIDFDGGLCRDDLQWCGGTYDSDGATPDARMAGVIAFPGVGGCIASQVASIVDGELAVTEILLLSGDPGGWR